jgi:PEP-CTERM motif
MSRNHRHVFASLVVLAVLVFASRGTNAAPIFHGNFPGATIDYLGVQEESSSDPGAELFGPPTVAGDNMDFNPQAFAASSTGLASDITDSNLQFMVKAHPGQAITGINFSEAGDTTLSGLAGEAMTTVGAVITGEIVEVNIGGVLTPVSINLPQLVMGFNPKDNFKLTVDGPGTKGWTGAALLNLIGNGVVTKVNITLDNSLSAASLAGASAFIQKKDADALVISTTTQPFVPEPGTAVIAMLAMALCGSVFRRR